MKFKVSVTRTVVEVTSVYVDADSQEEAAGIVESEGISDDTKWYAIDASSFEITDTEEQ